MGCAETLYFWVTPRVHSGTLTRTSSVTLDPRRLSDMILNYPLFVAIRLTKHIPITCLTNFRHPYGIQAARQAYSKSNGGILASRTTFRCLQPRQVIRQYNAYHNEVVPMEFQSHSANKLRL